MHRVRTCLDLHAHSSRQMHLLAAVRNLLGLLTVMTSVLNNKLLMRLLNVKLHLAADFSEAAAAARASAGAPPSLELAVAVLGPLPQARADLAPTLPRAACLGGSPRRALLRDSLHSAG